VRLGGLPDNPRTDPQDRTWFGPHDRLFIEEESREIDFQPGPDHGTFATLSVIEQDTERLPSQCGAGDGMAQATSTDRM
jgi:hypothetical protein